MVILVENKREKTPLKKACGGRVEDEFELLKERILLHAGHSSPMDFLVYIKKRLHSCPSTGRLTCDITPIRNNKK
jgi:hypothetical protein